MLRGASLRQLAAAPLPMPPLPPKPKNRQAEKHGSARKCMCMRLQLCLYNSACMCGPFVLKWGNDASSKPVSGWG